MAKTNLYEEIQRIQSGLNPTKRGAFTRGKVPPEIRNTLSYIAHKKQRVPATLLDNDSIVHQPFIVEHTEIYHAVLTDQIESCIHEPFNERLLLDVLGVMQTVWDLHYGEKKPRDGDMTQVRMRFGADMSAFECVLWAWKGFAHYPALLDNVLKRKY